MNLKELNRVYFLGIGGIGMSALARWFNSLNIAVSGYDKTETKLTKTLVQEGISIHYNEDISQIPENTDLIVYTPAIPENNIEFIHLSASEIPMLKRSKVLGMITELYQCIAVAGTHGKTTISSMISHILNANNIKLTAFVGGICNNTNSNLILNDNSEVVVVEADEYDKSFLNVDPDIAVISSMDADHLDIYSTKDNIQKTFFEFADKINDKGCLIYNSKLDFNNFKRIEKSSYSYDENSDFKSSNIRYSNEGVIFDIEFENKTYSDFKLLIPGQHNVENATAAIAAAYKFGLSFNQIKSGLSTYSGVERRFDIKVNSERVYIDDYAHHPEELKATISASRKMYPEKKITGIFQPHLYSRTRDFANEFARSLELLDEIILIDIYPARELPIPGITSEYLLELINHPNKKYIKNDELLTFIKEIKPEVLLTLGAGNIDNFVSPITQLIKKL